jgi:hypothetical protein
MTEGGPAVSHVQPTAIDALCQERGWSRKRLIGELRRVAKVKGETLPSDDALTRMIRAWNSGDRGLSELYASLLSTVFGVRFVAGKRQTPELSRRVVISAAALMVASARQSADLIERLSGTVEPFAIEQHAADAERLSVEYMSGSPTVMAEEAKLLRDRIMVAIERTRRPSQLTDLYLLAGRASGILAYAAVDLGDVRAAMANARASAACAELAGHSGLAAWVYGTQSLIARFAGRYAEAERYVLAGMELKRGGAGQARLAAGLAQCRANMMDAAGTRQALNAAMDAHSAGGESADGEVGLFGFARSKVHFYAASSLICLPDGAGAVAAAREASAAIKLFQSGPADERFITDEILVHIYGANAYLQQGNAEAATDLLSPVFGTPDERRVSWHRQRLGSLVPLLEVGPLRGSRKAIDLRSQLTGF